MALLRDVLARFSVLVDDKPLTKLDRKIVKVKQAIRKFGMVAGAGFGVAAFGAYKLVDAASNAQEALNVLNRTFEGNSASVIEWSKTMGKTLGRSEYTLQDSVGKFGAFLQPVFKDSEVDIAHYSKRLSELAVDLASFYNTSDEEAQMRLFSGVSGETEAVRRLGIDISDTSLSDFNHKRGDNRNLAQLTLQEKSMLRIEKIFKDTEKKQGDAALTSKDWANSLRRFQDQLKTLAVRLGNLILGPATKFLHWGESFLKFWENLSFKTSAWQAAFATASVVGLAYGARWLLLHKDLVKWSDLLNKQFWIMNAKVLAIAGAFLILEDLFTFMRGGKSVFGDILTDLTGVQRPIDLMNRAFEQMAKNLNNILYYMAQIGRWSPPALIGKLFGMSNANPFTYMEKTISESKDGNRDRLSQQALKAGDKEAYVNAQVGLGMSGEQIDARWAAERKTTLRSKQGYINDKDVASGLVEAPKFATMSNADRSKYYGGDKSTTVNLTFNNAADAQPDRVKQVVKEALDERDRQTAAEVGEAADEPTGGLFGAGA